MSTTTHIDKARGLLFGLALGDALGAPFEGKPGFADADITARKQADEPLRHTDDTALALVLADHLAQRRAARDGAVVDQDALAAEFAREWHREPWRGYGQGVARAFQLMSTGLSWRQATRSVFAEGSFGNGGAMRVAPVALVGADAQQVADLARRTAEVTHAHVDALHGAVCQAVATHLAVALDATEPVEADRFVERVGEVVPSPLWQDKLARVLDLARRRAEPEDAALALGNNVSAPGSVPLALLAFLRNAGSPSGAIRYAIRAGGDTDTIAAMAGAIAGAHSGVTALPAAALDRLEATDRLHALAERLA